jgi:hypothetical protein
VADRGKALLPLGPFGDLLGDLRVSDGDSSIGVGESSGGRFHTIHPPNPQDVHIYCKTVTKYSVNFVFNK